MSNKPGVLLQSLTLNFGDKPVLKDLSFSLEGGELLALIGPNGAGKSSLLRCLSGEYQFDGNINIQGLCPYKQDPFKLAQHMAVLPQHSNLSFPFTVEEIVNLGRLPHSSGIREDKRICKQALSAMDLTDINTQVYTRLSGGEKQRTQLARVLAQIWPDESKAFKLLLLDEPCSSLDPGHTELLIQQLKEFCQLGVGIVMVIHDVNFASRYADRIIALSEGEIVADGTNKQVIQEATLNRLFNSHGKVFTHPMHHFPVYL